MQFQHEFIVKIDSILLRNCNYILNNYEMTGNFGPENSSVISFLKFFLNWRTYFRIISSKQVKIMGYIKTNKD